jgi:uncharacterized protein (TIGR03067 family)
MATLLILFSLLNAEETTLDKDALKSLQGKWLMTAGEHGGKEKPIKEVAAHALEVDGAKLVIREESEVKEDAKITRLTTGKVGEMDVIITAGPDLDKVIKGIWKLESGNKLSICIAEPGKERPTKFEGKEGTGHTLLQFTKPKKGS